MVKLKKNKKGNTAILLFMIGVVFFLLGMAIAYPLSETVDESRDQLDCNNASISDQDKANCTTMDSMKWLYTGVIFGLAAVLVGRFFI